jgi:UPF0755 protein
MNLEFILKYFSDRTMREKVVLVFFVLTILCGAIDLSIWTPSVSFPQNFVVEIPEGTTLSQAANILYSQKIIRSQFWFKVLVVLQGGRRNITAGDYYFKKPQELGFVSSRLVYGISDLSLVRVTIPEGMTKFQIADLLSSKYKLFNKENFIAKAPEGYLFPDTYFFYQDLSAKNAIGRMVDVFNQKTTGLKMEAEVSKKNFTNIVIMASILEEEAKTLEDKKFVSQVLWKRISIGMALQVDSATSTYKTKGLPLVPISNPGLESLDAALHPATTAYLYYLSDLKGKIYYANDFEGHQKNRELHLGR